MQNGEKEREGEREREREKAQTRSGSKIFRIFFHLLPLCMVGFPWTWKLIFFFSCVSPFCERERERLEEELNYFLFFSPYVRRKRRSSKQSFVFFVGIQQAATGVLPLHPFSLLPVFCQVLMGPARFQCQKGTAKKERMLASSESQLNFEHFLFNLGAVTFPFIAFLFLSLILQMCVSTNRGRAPYAMSMSNHSSLNCVWECVRTRFASA